MTLINDNHHYHDGYNDTAVILFTGLPASGKSALAEILRERFHQYCHQHLVHIEYDSLESFLLSSMIEKEQGNLVTQHLDGGILQRTAWKRARQEAVKQMEQEIKMNANEKKSSSVYSKTTKAPYGTLNGHQSSLPSTIILMDDNFHLRGMRKQIHRLLLKYRLIRFGILHVQTPVDICLERNHNRTGRRKVPDEVILKMNAAFESPKTFWEVNSTIMIDFANKSTTFNGVSEYDEGFTAATATQATIENIIEFINNCPVIINTTENDILLEHQIAVDRTKTSQNQMHKVDKLLRLYVGRVAKFNKAYARSANAGRRKLMEDIKASRFKGNDDELLEAFLELMCDGDISMASPIPIAAIRTLLSYHHPTNVADADANAYTTTNDHDIPTKNG